MPGMSVHVVDVARGVVAEGLRVSVERLRDGQRVLLYDGLVGPSGLLDWPDGMARECERGVYEATFHVGAYFRQAGLAGPGLAFLDEVPYRFGLDDPAQHYHLPFKMTPWGFSCFRGGA